MSPPWLGSALISKVHRPSNETQVIAGFIVTEATFF